jgi:hypothetical protein
MPCCPRRRFANAAAISQAAVTAGHSRFFSIDRARLTAAAERVTGVTRRRYPDLAIPYHSRWRHFEAGGIDRRGELGRALAGRAPAERARAQIDLAVISVLLDAGAGPAWSYVEAESGQRFTRSEGLGVASFRAFMQGAFAASRRIRGASMHRRSPPWTRRSSRCCSRQATPILWWASKAAPRCCAAWAAL